VNRGAQLFDFPLADERGRFRAGPRLDEAIDDFRAGAGSQIGQFLQGFFRRDGCGPAGRRTSFPLYSDQDGALPSGRRSSFVRFAWR